jgi:hypothetical protein
MHLCHRDTAKRTRSIAIEAGVSIHREAQGGLCNVTVVVHWSQACKTIDSCHCRGSILITSDTHNSCVLTSFAASILQPRPIGMPPRALSQSIDGLQVRWLLEPTPGGRNRIVAAAVRLQARRRACVQGLGRGEGGPSSGVGAHCAVDDSYRTVSATRTVSAKK